MHIAQLVNSLDFGGAERLLVDLSLQLKSRGHAVNVVCLRGQGPLAKPLREAGVEVTSLEKTDGFHPGILGSLARFWKSRRIELIHTHNPLVHHYGVLSGRRAGVPAIVNTLHGFGNVDDSRKTRLVYDASSLLATRIVCVCHALEAHLRKVTWVAGRKSVTIPNGISLDRFLSLEPRAAGTEFLFGAVGRLAPVKDHRTLLRAFALLAPRYPQARLEILGDGPLHADLEQLGRELGIVNRFRIVPPMLDVSAFLSRLHVFVMSSRTEGLPLTLLEAMAAGVPVVATRVGAIPEIVLGAGCGWLSAAGDPAELAASMQTVIERPDREAIGLRGRRYALEFHSLEAMTDGYERLFEDLLHRKSAAFPSHSAGTAPASQ